MRKSILLVDKEVNAEKMGYSIPWNREAAGFNMHFPETAININADAETNWINKLGNPEEITAIFIECPLEKIEYHILDKMSNIEQIYISNAAELDSIDFVSHKAKLKDLCVSDSKISDLNPLVELMKYQSNLVEKYPEEFLTYQLQNVAITGASISDLSCFNGFDGSISDLNLQDNSISDLKPLDKLDIYYANFSHNQIIDIEDFMKTHGCTYLMNFRKNKIKSIGFMNDWVNAFPRRFFIGGNLFTDYSPLKGWHFVQSDIPMNTKYI